MATLSTSTSSSSAISMGSDVYVPCPISITGITNVTLPARSMRRKAFGANGASAVSVSRISPRAGSPNPSSNPPPRAAPTCRKLRREEETGAWRSLDTVLISPLLAAHAGELFVSRSAGRLLDRGADALIRAATADVTGHRIVDIRIARLRLVRQKRAGGHDLPRLAVATLRHIERKPC